MQNSYQEGYSKKLENEKVVARVQDLVSSMFDNDIKLSLQRKVHEIFDKEDVIENSSEAAEKVVNLVQMFLDSQTIQEAIADNLAPEAKKEEKEEEAKKEGVPGNEG